LKKTNVISCGNFHGEPLALSFEKNKKAGFRLPFLIL